MSQTDDSQYTAEYFELSDGTQPAYEFIKSLKPKLSAKMTWTVALLEEHGNALRLPYSEHLGDGIFELRAIQGHDIARVLYFFVVGKKVILTHGFVKDTNKTPPSEIERAKKYRKGYMSRLNSKENKL